MFEKFLNPGDQVWVTLRKPIDSRGVFCTPGKFMGADEVGIYLTPLPASANPVPGNPWITSKCMIPWTSIESVGFGYEPR